MRFRHVEPSAFCFNITSILLEGLIKKHERLNQNSRSQPDNLLTIPRKRGLEQASVAQLVKKLSAFFS
jgi:hypothetical protein